MKRQEDKSIHHKLYRITGIYVGWELSPEPKPFSH